MVTVPSSYVSLVQEAASGTGLPYGVVASQANTESGFQAGATSSAGAEGWLQFLPSTYSGVASQAGVPANSEYNPADEVRAYVVYMNQLLAEEGGSIYKALEAYNAGPGNLGAGAGYANSIMSAAGTPTNATATQQASTTAAGFTIPNPLNLIPGVGNIGSDIFGNIGQDLIGPLLSTLGLPSLKDALERFALIILGFVLVIVGIFVLTSGGGGGGQPIQITNTTTPTETTTTRRVNTPVVKHTSTTKSAVKGAGGNIASDAIEAAAVA